MAAKVTQVRRDAVITVGLSSVPMVAVRGEFRGTRRAPGTEASAKPLVWKALGIKVHLVDGTYELFHPIGAPPHRNAAGQEVPAVRGVVGSVLQLLGEGATHVGVAPTT